MLLIPESKLKIVSITYNPLCISIMTELLGIADLTQLDNLIIIGLNSEYNLILREDHTLYFNRLKVKKYRQKEGTIIVTKIIEICSDLDQDIFLDINPYDSENIISLKELLKFYKHFGFIQISDNQMVYYNNFID